MDPTSATVPEITSPSTVTPSRILFPPLSHHEQAHEDCVYHICLTSKHLITASRDHTVRVWDLETQRLAYAPLKGHIGSALCTAALEAQDLIFTGGVDGLVRIWRLSTGEKLATTLSQPSAGSVLSLAASSKYLVAAHKCKIAKVWTLHDILPALSADAETDSHVSETAVLDGHAAALNTVLISRDDAFVVTASGDRAIKIWEPRTWTCVRTIAGHMMGVACLAWLGEKLVSGSSDNTIRIWDLRTGAQEACLRGHSSLVRSVGVVVGLGWGEEVIVSGSYDESVVVWGRSGAGGVDGDGVDGAGVDGAGEDGAGKDGDGTWEIMKRFSPADMLGGERQDDHARVFRVVCDGKRIYAASQAKVVVAWNLSESSNVVVKAEKIG